MIDLLINWLTPTFVNMGASAADVANYLHAVESYIYWGVGALALMIVIMIAAHWLAKKGTRHVIRWTAALAFVTAVVVLVNAVCYGPLNALVSGVLNASKAEISDDVTGNSARVIEKIGEEGMVLVKNDGTLPLDKSKLHTVGVNGGYHQLPERGGFCHESDADEALSGLRQGLLGRRAPGHQHDHAGLVATRTDDGVLHG